MFYTQLEDYADYVADVLDSMGYEYAIDLAPYEEGERGTIYADVVVPLGEDQDEMEFDIERKINKVVGMADLTVTDMGRNEVTFMIEFETLTSYD